MVNNLPCYIRFLSLHVILCLHFITCVFACNLNCEIYKILCEKTFQDLTFDSSFEGTFQDFRLNDRNYVKKNEMKNEKKYDNV